MAIDWFAFLRQHGIPYTTVGPNASRGHVNVRCPFCGEADPSEHLGISLGGYGWSCWRNSAHRGRSEPQLIAALLKCSLAEAQALAGGTASLPSDEEFLTSIRGRLATEDDAPVEPLKLRLFKEFRPLNDGSSFSDQFWDYLRERGYRQSHIDWLCDTYDLHYALRGRFAYRIIIPFYDRYGALLTWTGRTILPDEDTRYKALKRSEQVCSPKDTFLGMPLLWSCPEPRVLLVCEGPFDAMWMTTFGRTLGVYATCLSGLSMSPMQMELLLELQGRFDYTALLLDSEAKLQAFRMANSGISLPIEQLPDGIKDPAVWPAGAVLDYCTDLISRI